MHRLNLASSKETFHLPFPPVPHPALLLGPKSYEHLGLYEVVRESWRLNPIFDGKQECVSSPLYPDLHSRLESKLPFWSLEWLLNLQNAEVVRYGRK
jgi:hypothetical protein